MATELEYRRILQEYGFQQEPPQFGVDLQRMQFASKRFPDMRSTACIENGGPHEDWRITVRIRGTNNKDSYDTGKLHMSQGQLRQFLTILVENHFI